jgi:N-acyl homoserine lactone hydrolase
MCLTIWALGNLGPKFFSFFTSEMSKILNMAMHPPRKLSGHPISLAVLDFGLFTVHANGRIIGIPGFLIETSAGEKILIDTGFPEKYAKDIQAASLEDNLGEFGELLELTYENQPDAQLAKLGLTKNDLDFVVITHTHIDHVGNIDGFPGVPIIIGKAERDLEKPIYWRGKKPLEWPDAEYLLIDSDFEFGENFQILHVPGHTPGELSILLTLPNTGSILLTSDAISRESEISEGCLDATDPAQAIASANRILDLAKARNAYVIYGHGPEQWKELKKAPEIYD